MKMEEKTTKHETLCFDCANAAGKCSWSKDFTPVEDWKAIPTRVKKDRNHGYLDSYDVYECPQYKKIRK